jgi:hypothetical protein
MSSLTVVFVARSINKAVTGITNWRISGHPEGKVAELARDEGFGPIGNNSSANPGTPIENFEVR